MICVPVGTSTEIELSGRPFSSLSGYADKRADVDLLWREAAPVLLMIYDRDEARDCLARGSRVKNLLAFISLATFLHLRCGGPRSVGPRREAGPVGETTRPPSRVSAAPGRCGHTPSSLDGARRHLRLT